MTRKRHHPLIRVLHWLVAFLIIAVFLIGVAASGRFLKA